MGLTVILNVNSELEARVREKASRHGQLIEEYLLSLAERDASAPDTVPDQSAKEAPSEDTLPWAEVIRRIETGYQPTPEEQQRSLRELLRGIHAGASLTDEDLGRGTIYEDRW